MSNASDGYRFEQRFCRMLGEHGFWVHRMSQNHGGQQPADVIAMVDGTGYLIDCKACSDSRFRLSRMEANQRTAMDLWLEKGGTDPKFALEDADGNVWILSYLWARAKEEAGEKTIPCQTYMSFVLTLDEWVEWVKG